MKKSKNLLYWNEGDEIVLRYITRDGRPGMTWPATVIVDNADLVALYIPKGTIYKQFQPVKPEDSNIVGYQRVLKDTAWRRDVLRLMYPGQFFSIWVFWEYSDNGREHTSYYVNMEEPFRRSKVGFDTTSAIKLPRGSTSERPTDTSTTTPYMRWNSTNSALEVYNGSEWVEIITDYFPSGSTAFS